MQIVGPPKNLLHFYNPSLLQMPIFKDAVVVAPFMGRGVNSVMNLVDNKAMTISAAGTESWDRDEYGSCWKNTSATITTNYTTETFDYNNWTFVMWASTDSVLTGRQMLGGHWKSASQYLRFGRSSNNFYIYVKSPTGTQSLSVSGLNNNDGKTHCWIGSANHLSLDAHFDGALVGASGAPVGTALGDSAALEIGAYDSRSDSWVGSICMAMMWNRGLSLSECRQIYEMGPSLAPVNEEFPVPYRTAIGSGTPSFNAAWAFNSNQVLL